MKVRIVVPWRDRGDLRRRLNKRYVVNRLIGLDLGEVVVSSDERDGPFNRSAAYNNGLDDADVYVWHEADMIVPHDQLLRAIWMASKSPGLVVPFTTYAYLGEDDSLSVVTVGDDPTDFTPERKMTDGRAIGAVGVTSRETMIQAGSWDESFSGWGYDDRAMLIAFEKTTRPTRWVLGDGVHLWHPPAWQAGEGFAGGSPAISAEERQATERNRNRLRLYKAARDSVSIRALTLGS